MRRLLVGLAMLLCAHAALGTEELRLMLERHSLTATWRTYHQFIDGVEVVGSAVIERVDGNGEHEVERHIARAAATSAWRLAPNRQSLTANRFFVNVNGEARPAYRTVVNERPLEPVAHYYDAETGAEIRTEPLFWTAKARVFAPNPVAKLNDPSLRDHNNAASAVPDSAYSIVDLPDLPLVGPLVGPNVAIVDSEQPFTVHADAAGSLLFDRSQPQFEEVNAYFHIDRSQRYMQSIGFRGARRIVDYAIPVDPHAASGGDNSYYIGGLASGMGSLSFGDGGTDDAEDSDIMLHEFGHAIQDWIAPGAFGGPPSAQARAIGEGFGDYWAFSQNYLDTVVTGRTPYCIADWDARCAGDDASQNCGYSDGADCLRRVDSTKTMANYVVSDTPGTEHRNGEIWSSALREIFMALVQQNGAEQGRRIADATVLEGTFGVPPNPTFNVMARKLLDADRALWGGAHLAMICGSMAARGIIAASDCGVLPRGELTFFQSGVHGVPIPDGSGEITATAVVTDTRPIDKLLVRVDIEHPSRGDLKITLVAPDGTSLLLQAPSLDRVADVHATFGSDIEPAQSLAVFNGKSIAGVWKLVIADTRAGDAGRLVSWSIVANFSGDTALTLRPFSTAPRLNIPVVARTGGLSGSLWRSDLYLYNRGSSEAKVTIVYTPSGADGTVTFGAVTTIIAAKQLVAFRNVVGQLYGPSGSGTLELQGDVQQLTAWSATYDASGNGTVGQSVDAVRSTDAAGAGESLWLDALAAGDGAATRTNVGVVETAGESGIVTVTLYDAVNRAVIDTRTLQLLPFMHLQFPLPPQRDLGPRIAEVRVASGNARVIAYASVVTAGQDSMYVPARSASAPRREVIPAAALTGGAGTTWQTDLWIDNVLPAAEQVFTPPVPITYFASTPAQFKGITRSGIGSSYLANFVSTLGGFAGTTGQIELDLPRGVLATSFLYSAPQRRGDTILPVAPSEAIGAGDTVDAIRIENDAAFRTNVGFTEVAGGTATVRISLVDAGGNEIAATTQDVAPRGRVQLGIVALTPRDVVDARVHFEVLSGSGRVVAYASVVDNASQDAYFVRAR
ncbi:MAG TPA: proprotein convertase P-domain-containing protein [Thermoanaerobaculia bacterium]|nr:proprotein convertase P-domain-containing protein [Thermoanaerobaculia bacterium]